MTQFLLRLFFRQLPDPADPTARGKIGIFSGIVGIFCNLLLFTGKLIVGLVSHSVSITADAMNNLSDATSSVVTMLGFRLAEQLLVFKQLVLFLPVHQCVQKCKGLLILGIGVHQLFPAAQRPGHVVKLAAAHFFFLQVDHLEFDPPLLEIALGLFGIKALAGAEDLNVHGTSLLKVYFTTAAGRCIGIIRSQTGHTACKARSQA